MTVVAFRPRLKTKPPVVQLPDVPDNSEAINFISSYLYPWALERGVDLNSTDFKYESAVIMTVIQGMTHRANK